MFPHLFKTISSQLYKLKLFADSANHFQYFPDIDLISTIITAVPLTIFSVNDLYPIIDEFSFCTA